MARVRWSRNPDPKVNTQFIPRDKVKLCPTARYVGAGDHVCECTRPCPAFATKVYHQRPAPEE